MAVAFDAGSNSHAGTGSSTGDFSWTHTPVGTPKGALVIIVTNAEGIDEIAGVTYGGAAMTEVPLSPFLHTAGAEDATLTAYFLGSGVPTGAQTVAVTTSGTTRAKVAEAITFTASADTEVDDTSTFESSSSTSVQVTLTTTVDAVCIIGAHSGAAQTTWTIDGSSTEIRKATITGTMGYGFARRATTGAGSFTLGWTSASADEQGTFGVAVREAAAAQAITDGGAIATAEAFGTGSLSFQQDLTDGGALASAEAFGTGKLAFDQDLADGGGIASAEAFGTGSMSFALTLTDGGAIASAEAFGAGTLVVANDGVLINGGGIASAEAFGTGEVGALVFIDYPEGSIQGEIAQSWVGAGAARRRYGPELEVFISNRDGSINRRMFQYSNLEVVHAFGDARTARFTAPIDDLNALFQSNIQHFLPLSRLVTMIYRGRPIFWGPITKPAFNFHQRTVEVFCHDPSIYWKNHHLDDRDAEDNLHPLVNGVGLEELALAAEPTTGEFADGAIDTGILFGGPAEAYLLPGEEERRTMDMNRGDAIFEAIQNLADPLDGPEWELRPINEDYNPFDLAPDPGHGVMLIAREELGTDKSDSVIFHYGFGRTNLVAFTYEPDGTAVRNRAVVTDGRGRPQVAKYTGNWDSYGIMESWESAAGDDVKPAQRREKAKIIVQNYSHPLPIFTLEPTWDQGQMGSAAAVPWRYPTGYTVGDRIRAIAKCGRMEVDLIGRVTQVTLTQLNAAENVKAQVECVPKTIFEDDIEVGTALQ